MFENAGIKSVIARATHVDTEKKAKKIVFIGAGFINLELASLPSTVRADYYNVTIVELLGHPLPLMLDAEMGFKIQKYLVGKGFNMLIGHKVTKIIGSNGYVSGVELETGEKIDADIVMLSVGTTPKPGHLSLFSIRRLNG
ncbi:FAD-dependent oxidoreductase [Desulfobacula sp.]|uniref:FAD-dependent oxidoreductase n=1 Tax=Desulfobacula sp. TaxID=2593537 RepID=UPI0025BEFE63|nr:FAD-dependent oxidoreductase [Desulfobacula sp.]